MWSLRLLGQFAEQADAPFSRTLYQVSFPSYLPSLLLALSFFRPDTFFSCALRPFLVLLLLESLLEI